MDLRKRKCLAAVERACSALIILMICVQVVFTFITVTQYLVSETQVPG